MSFSTESLPSNDREFYPTPALLVNEMLQGIDWFKVRTILEPSAGKGNILRELALKGNIRSHNLDVDAIEIDPNLRQILKWNFSEERKREIDRDDPEYFYFFSNGIHIVHDDFLTYEPFKQYDLIIMNPPFVDGDKHLLKALSIQKDGGKIVCLLNAETIKNPYSATRKELVRLLKEYSADIRYCQNAFVSAERKTGVEIAIIKVDIPHKQYPSDIYNNLREAEQYEDYSPEEMNSLEVTDVIKATVNRFRLEVKAGLELIRQYKAMVPYMRADFSDNSSPILKLTDDSDRSYLGISVNSYLQKVRLKYWTALLDNPQFTSKLTSTLTSMYRKQIEKLADYDYSEFNIHSLITDMNSKIVSGVESEIEKMFERLTAEHSWYPECSKNAHYYDGWATNKATKIGKKVIIPCYGVYDQWDGRPRVYQAREQVQDIERILNYFAGNISNDINSWKVLEESFKDGNTKNIELKYFTVTFYKKGTMHLVFNCPELIDRYNIYVGKGKNWLPPNYGKVRYADMGKAEQSVVDNFNGDSSEGSGETAYRKIMSESNYYLTNPVTSPLMIGA